MNSIRSIQALNKRELEAGVAPSASWHRDFADTAFVYIGGLPFTLSEGDLITIFSQFGEPVFVNLVRDKETGKSKGFAFLKYEDQRSTDLAVDNLGGATVMGRVLRVDHTRYKRKDDEDLGDNTGGIGEERNEGKGTEGDESGMKRVRSGSVEERPMLEEEVELAKLLRDHDDEDPMKGYLIQEKREEVAAAIKAHEATKSQGKHNRRDDKARHRHRDRHEKHRESETSDGRRGDQSHPNSRRHRSPVAGTDSDRDGDRDRRHRHRNSDDSQSQSRSRERTRRRDRSTERYRGR